MTKKYIPLKVPVWKEAPLLILLVPFITGIIWSRYFLPDEILLLITCFIALILSIIFHKKRNNILFGICSFIFCVCLGAALLSSSNIEKKLALAKKQVNTDSLQTYRIIITEPLVKTEKTYKAECMLYTIDSSLKTVRVPLNAIVYFEKATFVSLNLNYGTTLIVKAKVQEIKNSGNPGAFKYRDYALANGIGFQIYAKGGMYKPVNSDGYTSIYNTLYTTRDWILNIFDKYIPDEANAGFSKALLVGYRNDIDKNILQEYIESGVVHVIAISGMHLGLIYVLLVSILSFLERWRYGKIAGALIIITVLWLFSLMTGGAPSITRAAFMFSILVIGKILGRPNVLFNSMAFSAICLLFYNPYYLWDVGFQLSYAALLGIAIFSKKFTDWIEIKNKFLFKSWEIIAVTLSAQVFTLPFVIYYFHQFPVYFIISNLLAVPLSGIILYFLIGLVTFHWVPYLGDILGTVIHWLIVALNKSIVFINNLPFSRITDINYGLMSVILLTVSIAFFSISYIHKNKRCLFYGMAVLLIIPINQLVAIEKFRSQNEIIIYNVTGEMIADIFRGGYLDSYSTVNPDSAIQLYQFHIAGSRLLHKSVVIKNNFLKKDENYTLYRNNVPIVAIINKLPKFIKNEITEAEFVLLGKNCKMKPKYLVKVLKTNCIILASDYPEWLYKEWLNEKENLNLRIHYLKLHGALVHNF